MSHFVVLTNTTDVYVNTYVNYKCFLNIAEKCVLNFILIVHELFWIQVKPD